MKTAALLLTWLTAMIVVLAALFSAFVGRADFGDGRGSSISIAGVVGLIAVAVLTIAIAIWLTRLLSR